MRRVAAFAKRLLQLASAAQPNWACGALLLLSQVLAAQPALWAAITQPEDVGGGGVEAFRDPEDPDAAEDEDGEGGAAGRRRSAGRGGARDDDDEVERFRDVDGSDEAEEVRAGGTSLEAQSIAGRLP